VAEYEMFAQRWSEFCTQLSEVLFASKMQVNS